jgi:release factor glutamine methyltransferase
MTVLEALQRASGQLKGVASASAMLDAEVLLAHALGMPKNWLFTHLDYSLREHELDAFTAFVERRTAREPIAYIVESKEFYGRKFKVNASTLIPRPATESLVDAAMEAANGTEDVLFADIGTGSGAIAITLAAETKLPVFASDVSPEALAVAVENAKALDTTVDFKLGNLLEPLIERFRSGTGDVKHLVLCANLPYLTKEQVDGAEPDVKDFEPHAALEAGVDGLDCYFELFRQLKANRTLFPERVTVLIEIDPVQREKAVALILHDFPASRPVVLQDLSGTDRIVLVEI